MIFVWTIAFILLIIIVLIKEHQDRKAPVLIGELVQGDGFAPPIKKVMVKSWWEKFWEFARTLIAAGAFIGVGWMLNELIGMVS